jgi:hypothetical protein
MKIGLIGIMGICLVFLPVSVYSERYITGELSGVYPADEYVITGNIYVLPRTTLRFDPGSTLRFENFTGMIVRGELICKGTILRPIRFTSSRDIPSSRIMPEAFDWNGIKVMPEAINICLEFCSITYSTAGLEIASNTTPVILNEVTFSHNGSASLTREREMITLEDNVPVSFRWPLEQEKDNMTGRHEDDRVADKTKSVSTVQKSHDSKPIELKKPVMYASGGLTFVCGLAAAASYGLAWYYDRKYDKAPPGSDFKSLKANRDHALLGSGIALAVASIGAVAFTVTYVF